ncbi:MAG: hypothetical protein EAZ50_07550 [Runella slithyformis]|nr:MAG: hypothetical protein EAZ50_07550 [Runella slithyformis]
MVIVPKPLPQDGSVAEIVGAGRVTTSGTMTAENGADTHPVLISRTDTMYVPGASPASEPVWLYVAPLLKLYSKFGAVLLTDIAPVGKLQLNWTTLISGMGNPGAGLSTALVNADTHSALFRTLTL